MAISQAVGTHIHRADSTGAVAPPSRPNPSKASTTTAVNGAGPELDGDADCPPVADPDPVVMRAGTIRLYKASGSATLQLASKLPSRAR
jgi:hypothetical protein